MPTYCRSIGASLSVLGERPECSPPGFPRGAEAPLLHRIRCRAVTARADPLDIARATPPSPDRLLSALGAGYARRSQRGGARSTARTNDVDADECRRIITEEPVLRDRVGNRPHSGPQSGDREAGWAEGRSEEHTSEL